MKKMVLRSLLFSACLTGASLVATAQVGEGYWSYSNPKPFGFTCTANAFINDNIGVVVGFNGGIARTIDGGATWSHFAFSFLNNANKVIKPNFQDVQFFDANTVIAVGSNGTMARSKDGGLNWSLVKTPFYNSGTQINTVHFISASYGIIAGEPMNGQTAVYLTTNGGNSWSRSSGLPDEGRNILKIRFNGNAVGYAVGTSNEDYSNGGANLNSVVWKFSGSSWKDYSIKATTQFTNVRQKDTTITAHCCDEFADTVYSTYQDNITGLNSAAYRSIAIITDDIVVIGSQNNGQIIRITTSTAAGSYLMANNGLAPESDYRTVGGPSVYNMSAGIGALVATGGSNMLLSIDNGRSFKTVPVYKDGPASGLEFFAIAMTPGKRFALAGANGVIADSFSGVWHKPYIVAKKAATASNSVGSLASIAFLDANKGLAAGWGGTLLATANGGDSWEDKSTPGFSETDGYTGIDYKAANALLAITKSGGFLKSADEGASFDLFFQEPSGGSFAAMQFPTNDSGFIIANIRYPDNVNFVDTFHKILYRTTDGGLSWDSAINAFPTTTDYAQAAAAFDMKFLDSKTGFIVGDQGSIYKTIDGGLTWAKKEVPADITGILESVAVADDMVAYAVGRSGAVLKTTDGGDSWQKTGNGLPTDGNYHKVLAYNAEQAMVFSNGDIYTTIDAGGSWSPYYSPVGGFNMFTNACFAQMADCNTGVCRKIFASTSLGQVLKFDVDQVLTVKFSNLSASATAQGNQLFWTSFSQQSVQDYVVEGSADGITFSQVSGRIAANGLDYESHSWLHATAPAGKYYYRVKANEIGGASFYTNTVALSGIRALGWKHQLSHGSLLLTNTQAKAGTVKVQVANAAGQIVAAKDWDQAGGAFNNLLLLPATAHGVHYAKLTNAGTVYSFTILIQ